MIFQTFFAYLGIYSITVTLSLLSILLLNKIEEGEGDGAYILIFIPGINLFVIVVGICALFYFPFHYVKSLDKRITKLERKRKR